MTEDQPKIASGPAAADPVSDGAAAGRPSLVLVTGRAGAGRSASLFAIEDIGYRRVDTPPLGLVPEIAAELVEKHGLRVAIGVDSQTVGFAADPFREMVARLRDRFGDQLSVLYLDCEDAVLARRYTETRRRHPLAPEETVEAGLERDRELMGPVRALADVVLNTSTWTPADLKRELQRRYTPVEAVGLVISVESFSYKRGAPSHADMVFDCRFLRNPHYEAELRPKTGREAAVKAYVEADPRYGAFLEKIEGLLDLLVPAFQDEGKSYLTIAFGCTGGKHRSVAVAEAVAAVLRKRGWPADLRHREQHVEQDGDARGARRTGQADTG